MASGTRSSATATPSRSSDLGPRQTPVTHQKLGSGRPVLIVKLPLPRPSSKSILKNPIEIVGPASLPLARAATPAHSYHLHPRQTHKEINSGRPVSISKFAVLQSSSKSTLRAPIEIVDRAGLPLARAATPPHSYSLSPAQTNQKLDVLIVKLRLSRSSLKSILKNPLEIVKEPSFTLFPKFPPELRRMVWSCTLTSPHLIELRSQKMVPHVRESITIMAVCREAREVALKHYQLVKLGPSIATSPFYFSPQTSICLLKDKPGHLILYPLRSQDKSHSWNMFREKVTVLAVDPFLYYDPTADLVHPFPFYPASEPLAAASRALKICAAISVMPGLKKLILMSSGGSERYLKMTVEFMQAFTTERHHAARTLMPHPLSIRKLPLIEFQDYKCRDGEDAYEAASKALLKS